ncbi:MAG TPA: YihY/virulence factor BrkB family protein [Calditrichia bacterium]|nr:YihY/virulence factor BrkB family protein [Calditrichota bacterium]HQU72556.1 YihY/virulence factor BrkB family protein [Calditrichia bacterium]HQV33503.1 YihY/virulence factor BrkB family protein [Calditrichia bacterium]
MIRLRAFWRLLKLTVSKWQDDNVSWLSAALAYYTLFSLAPTVILVVSIGGTIFGEEAVAGEVVRRIGYIVGLDNAKAIQSILEAGQGMGQFSWANLFTVVVLIYAATNVFSQLKMTLNAIWDSTPRRHWIQNWLIARVLSVVMILAIGILLIALVLTDIALAGFNRILATYLPVFERMYLWKLGNFAGGFILLTLLFAAIYRLVPDRSIPWADILPGAILVSFVFSAGKFLMSLYVSSSRIITLFGAASSFVIILVWVYFSAQLLMLGAAFIRNYAELYGSLSQYSTRSKKMPLVMRIRLEQRREKREREKISLKPWERAKKP